MIGNYRRLVVLHFVLGLVSVIVYFMRPGSISLHAHHAGRIIALTAIVKVFVAWIPYFISGYYSCDVLPQRDPKATLAFMGIATVVAIIAACLTLIATRASSAPLLVFAGVTVVLVASARVCAAIWPEAEPEWDIRL